MTGDVKRTRGGQFVPGQSGNAAGARPRRPRELMTPLDVSQVILEVAASDTRMSIEGRIESVTMLKRSVLALASGQGNRPAAKDFIEITKSAAWLVKREKERAAEAEKSREQRF